MVRLVQQHLETFAALILFAPASEELPEHIPPAPIPAKYTNRVTRLTIVDDMPGARNRKGASATHTGRPPNSWMQLNLNQRLFDTLNDEPR